MKLSQRKIMVTGAGGFIGSHLSERLAADNDLVLVDDFSVGFRENVASLENRPGVKIVEADITDRERMQELTAGVEVVIHMAISCLRSSLEPADIHWTHAKLY